MLQEILRRQLRFEGVILADDLGMGAIARRYGPGESVVKTLEAGSDIAMLCHDSTVVPEAIEAVAQSLKERPLRSSAVVGKQGAHRAIARATPRSAHNLCRRSTSSVAPNIAHSRKKFAPALLTRQTAASEYSAALKNGAKA